MARRSARRRPEGAIVALRSTGGWQARYQNPNDPRKRVSKNFKNDQKSQATAWLDRELDYVRRCELKLDVYKTPSERKAATQAKRIRFDDYATQWLENYHAADGTVPRASSMRQKRTAVRHCVEYFGNCKLTDISVAMVDKFLDSGVISSQAGHSLRRAYQALKAIMKTASTPVGDKPALIPSNPCIRPVPRTKPSQQALIPEATREELDTICNNMPDYLKIAPITQAVFALRISELCALQAKDFDFKRGVLHVRHALKRTNADDTGQLMLAATKTTDSSADLPIPSEFVPELQEHIKTYTDYANDHDAMFLKAPKAKILAPNSLRNYFDEARKAAGRPDLHSHTLRATGITLAARNGTPKETQLYGRHDDAEVSLERYQRANRQGLEHVASAVFEGLKPVRRTRTVVAAELESVELKLNELAKQRDTLRAELKGLKNE